METNVGAWGALLERGVHSLRLESVRCLLT